VLIDSPRRDDTLVGVRPPGPSPRDAVSIKSSQDKRPKRSPGETRDQEGTAISARSRAAARTNELDAGKRRPIIGVRKARG
jgi:hypothetical protein